MGLFGKKKDKTITMPRVDDDVFIQPISKSYYNVKLGEKLKVDKDWSAVFVLKDRPLDVLNEGEWDLSIPMIPKINKLLKLDKSRVVTKGRKQQLVFQESFDCDLYFVNKKPLILHWQTRLVRKKPAKEKGFGIMAKGSCVFRTDNPENTIRLFLLEWGKIPYNKAKIRLNRYINEFATEALEFCPCSSYKDVMFEEQIKNIIEPCVKKNLNKYGIQFDSFILENLEFSKEIAEVIRNEKIEIDVGAEKTEISAEISLDDKNLQTVTTRAKNSKVAKSNDEVIDFTKSTDADFYSDGLDKIKLNKSKQDNEDS